MRSAASASSFSGATRGHEEATFIRDYSASVSLIPIDGSVAVAGDGVGVLDSPMAGLALSDLQVVVTLKNGETHNLDTLYAAMGTSVRTDLAGRLGVRLAEGGCVVVDAEQRTSVDWVYAIGDVTDGRSDRRRDGPWRRRRDGDPQRSATGMTRGPDSGS